MLKEVSDILSEELTDEEIEILSKEEISGAALQAILNIQKRRESRIFGRLEIGLLTAMARNIKGRGKEKEKRQELFVNFFKERFSQHVRTANLDYIGQWVGRFNCGTCYRNADEESTRILQKLGYTEGP
jgi:hypothetical protein